MTLATTHVFWLTTRGAGITALVLSSLSVTAGVSIRSSVASGGRGLDLRTLHETLSLAALVAVAVHGITLVADPWLHPGITGIALPFSMSYRPFWTGLGTIAGYGLAVLGLSYYFREHIGPARWKTAHRFIAVFWILGIGHALGAGTDAGKTWFLATLAITALPGFALLSGRFLARQRENSSSRAVPSGRVM